MMTVGDIVQVPRFPGNYHVRSQKGSKSYLVAVDGGAGFWHATVDLIDATMVPCEACPACGSTDMFFHCHEKCTSVSHAVDCLNCKLPFLSNLNPRVYLKDDLLKRRGQARGIG